LGHPYTAFYRVADHYCLLVLSLEKGLQVRTLQEATFSEPISLNLSSAARLQLVPIQEKQETTAYLIRRFPEGLALYRLTATEATEVLLFEKAIDGQVIYEPTNQKAHLFCCFSDRCELWTLATSPVRRFQCEAIAHCHYRCFMATWGGKRG
jgi:hypothetical protein